MLLLVFYGIDNRTRESNHDRGLTSLARLAAPSAETETESRQPSTAHARSRDLNFRREELPASRTQAQRFRAQSVK